MVFLRKLKLIYPSIPPTVLQQLFNPHLFNVIQKMFSHTPILERGKRLCILYERLQRRDNKVINILYDRLFIYTTVKS